MFHVHLLLVCQDKPYTTLLAYAMDLLFTTVARSLEQEKIITRFHFPHKLATHIHSCVRLKPISSICLHPLAFLVRPDSGWMSNVRCFFLFFISPLHHASSQKSRKRPCNYIQEGWSPKHITGKKHQKSLKKRNHKIPTRRLYLPYAHSLTPSPPPSQKRNSSPSLA